jgi:hypothetical protein
VFEDESETLGETDLRILSHHQEKRRCPGNLQEKSQAQAAPGSKEVALEWHESQEWICREKKGSRSR